MDGYTIALPRTWHGMRVEWAPQIQTWAGLLAEGMQPQIAAQQAGADPDTVASLLADPSFRRALRNAIIVPAQIDRDVLNPSCNVVALGKRLAAAWAALREAEAAAAALGAGVAKEDALDEVYRRRAVVSSLERAEEWARAQIVSAREELDRLANPWPHPRVSDYKLDRWRKEVAYNRRILKNLSGETYPVIRIEA